MQNLLLALVLNVAGDGSVLSTPPLKFSFFFHNGLQNPDG
jgi:hypothetical protein